VSFSRCLFPIHAFRSLSVGRKADYSVISLSMPRSFAEVWLRIYTKECKFFGLVQAAYRQILKMLQPSDVTDEHPHDEAEQEDPDLMIKIWTPGTGTESPGTPRSSSRNASLGSLAELRAAAGQLARSSTPGGARGRTVGRTPSFSDNQFTTVPPNFRDPSPSRKPRSKRTRDVSDTMEGAPPPKSLRLASGSSSR